MNIASAPARGNLLDGQVTTAGYACERSSDAVPNWNMENRGCLGG